MYSTFLFIYALAGALYLGFVNRVFSMWTGGLNNFALLIATLLAASSIGYFLRNRMPRWVCPLLFLGAAVSALVAWSDADSIAKVWQLKSLRIGLTYREWYVFAINRAVFWLVPTLFALTLSAWTTRVPRGKLSLLVGFCVGMILMRIFSGRLPTLYFIEPSILLMMLSGVGMVAFAYQSKIARIGLSLLFPVAAVVWFSGTKLATYEPLRDVNPFASIAAKDTLYPGIGSEGYVLSKGRVIESDDIGLATRVASQALPMVLKPQPNARMLARTQRKTPIYSNYETTELKGLYDAILVELPPAWMPEEREYFDKAALSTILSHLQPAGVLIYTIDVRCLDAVMVMERLSILHRLFGHIQLWAPGLNTWQLVASREPINAPFELISNLMDRAPVAENLLRANIASPVALLSSYLTDRFEDLLKTQSDPVAPKLRRKEATAARKMLFDGAGGKRLLTPFESCRDMKMGWVQIPAEDDAVIRPLLQSLQEGRALVSKGLIVDASQYNPCDPFLLGLSDSEIVTAKSWEKLAEHQKALDAYIRAFKIAAPKLLDVLDAAGIAERCKELTKADELYKLAVVMDGQSELVFMKYAHFLDENKRYAEAQDAVEHALPLTQDAMLKIAYQYFIYRMQYLQGQKQPANIAARKLAEVKREPEMMKFVIPAYIEYLKQTTQLILWNKVKGYYEAYGELLPEETK